MLHGDFLIISGLRVCDLRASDYDAYIAKETEKEILAERVERRKRQMEMLNGFDELVGKRLKTLNPDDLNADGAMDLLERSVKLDSFITGADKENAKPVQGKLENKSMSIF